MTRPILYTYTLDVGRLLGIKPDHAEDALHSERAARAVLTRRNLFAAGGALAAGSVFSFAVPQKWIAVARSRAITITLPPLPESFYNGRIVSITINGRMFSFADGPLEFSNL